MLQTATQVRSQQRHPKRVQPWPCHPSHQQMNCFPPDIYPSSGSPFWIFFKAEVLVNLRIISAHITGFFGTLYLGYIYFDVF